VDRRSSHGGNTPRDAITWLGDRTRCVVTITDEGSTQIAHHEVRDGTTGWSASMDVTLRKIR
jgi:hypothetical protein